MLTSLSEKELALEQLATRLDETLRGGRMGRGSERLPVRADSSFAGAESPSSTQSADVGTRFAVHKSLVVGFETLLNYKCCVSLASETNICV
jgi:hypothetical protein